MASTAPKGSEQEGEEESKTNTYLTADPGGIVQTPKAAEYKTVLDKQGNFTEAI
jgi:hypothetical protein